MSAHNIMAGGGFARMAWELAKSRVPHASKTVAYVYRREAIEAATPGCFPVHREYYRIIDDVSDRWARTANQIRLGASTSNWRMQL